MKTSIVLGLCFGDEGKGAITSLLSSVNTLVIRFNGGHQAGHTVEKDGYRHVFSNFGAGTLNGAHTYWSEYCTFCPKAFYNERAALVKAGYNPVHFIHPMSMVTTPFDREHNKQSERRNLHGSVGVGFGATVARNTETPYKLFAIDMQYKPVMMQKLLQIAAYYGITDAGKIIEEFIWYVENSDLNICTLAEIKRNYEKIVFEGAQGIMLDMDFGFFPNVTRSNTTSKNAIQIIKGNNLPTPDIYYVMRSYLTRHGNGYMPNESSDFCFPDQTNVTHEFQGVFRQGYHCSEMLNHAVNIDSIYSGTFGKKLVVTCLDQTKDQILIDNGVCNKEELPGYFKNHLSIFQMKYPEKDKNALINEIKKVEF